VFLDTFGLASLDELHTEARMEELFATVYGAEFDSPSNNLVI